MIQDPDPIYIYIRKLKFFIYLKGGYDTSLMNL